MIAVLGSSSFMGSFLVDTLLTEGHDVLGVSRNIDKNALLKPYLRNPNVSNFVHHQCDIDQDWERYNALLDQYKPSVVINCIARGIVDPSWDVPGDYYMTNCVSLTRVAQHLVGCDYLDKFMQASTPEVYGNVMTHQESTIYNPTTPYAASKAAFDMYLEAVRKQCGFPVVMFRAANIYGPHQQLFRIIPLTLIKIKKHEQLGLDGGGATSRYFIHSSDLSDGIIKLMNSEHTGVFHFAGDEYVSMRQLVQKICNVVGYDFDSLVTDVPERRGKDINYDLDCGKANYLLDWHQQIDLDEGIRGTSDWINNNWEAIKTL